MAARAARQAIPERRGLSFIRRERRPVFRTADHGLIVHRGEVALDRTTKPSDPLIGLRAGALVCADGSTRYVMTSDWGEVEHLQGRPSAGEP